MPPQVKEDDDARTPLLGYNIDTFTINAKQLVGLVEHPNLLPRLGGTSGICQSLRVDPTTGLLPDETFDPCYGVVVPQKLQHAPDFFADRKSIFGKNEIPSAPTKTFLQLIWVAYYDQTLIMLTIASIISLMVGIWDDHSPKHPVDEPKVGWVEGVAILVAVTVVVITNAINDYEKEKQFQKLNAKKEDRPVKVLRSGLSQQIHIQEIVVGDILFIEPGDILNVDCLYIEGHNLRCDESAATGESKTMKKDIDSKGDCVIISGSKVVQGFAKVIVVAVGVNSHYGRAMTLMRDSKEETTPLQLKLNVLADQIAKFGFIAAGIMLFVLILKMGVISFIDQRWLPTNELTSQLISIVIQAITVIVVAVPEGLPMAVTLALAFATTEMLKDNNLVRHLSACETMGNATTVCSDKTGTLTENKMSVVCASIANKQLNSFDDLQTRTSKSFATDLAAENMSVNSTAFEGRDTDGNVRFIGSTTECAMLEFVTKLGYSYNDNRKSTQCAYVYPFNSTVKSMTTVIKTNDSNAASPDRSKYRIYTKGAPEMVIQACSHYLDSDGQVKPLNSYIRVDQEMLVNSYAGRSLRALALAYRDVDTETFNAFHSDDPPLKQLVLIGIIGVQDKLRQGVVESVQEFRRAGVFVRMITGDNLQTAKSIARECGILTSGGVAMTGPDFRALSAKEQHDVIPRLQVLARSSPIDKTLVVTRLQELNEVVAMTGDGTNDGPALKLANVGFAMGITGTEVAKEASDIILMDDNFNSILQSLKWGRAVNDGVRKFLVFQLTVNIAAVVLSFVSAVLSDTSESILSAVQLLWVNMIMDTFAALALATEPLTDELVNRKPLRKDASLINWRMGRMIMGQAIFQIAVNLLLMFHGPSLFGLSDSVEDTKILRTMVFNVFVFLQVFNELNCRRIDDRLNIMRGITHDRLFLVIQGFTVAGQMLIIQYGGLAFKTVPLTLSQWLFTVAIGSLSIPAGTLIRLLPNHLPGVWSENNDDEFNHAVSYSRLRWESVVSRIMRDIHRKKNADIELVTDTNLIQPVETARNMRQTKASNKRHAKV
ncbi:PMCA-type calcium-translocating P-type ATPase [Mucor mucedo]|uniref:PMCA-type calcium-translocating P-type ATPase n=1 Tax=Mucor mucedo TaxID=29922 RepID=UPI00221E860D|nr:PMCA-type calcium-translocating P-type ATPase [Mucor mucedo]KAI7873113.1 PMCA-type calcium-translocating P-type ATPase [Mucor mucedo]